MMLVMKMRRGWHVRLSDNEYAMLNAALKRGLAKFERANVRASLPHKVRKVLRNQRWALPHGPLIPDEDRRPEERDGDRRN